MIQVSGEFLKSEYEKNLEAAITSELAVITAITSATLTNTYTLDITEVRNFNLLNADTAGKTLTITGVPTAASTYTELNININFTTTATITYTGTITWSSGTSGSTVKPTPTAVGTFVINLKTFDNGVNWRGTFSGLY